MTKINQKTIEYLANLARIGIKKDDEEKLLKDLAKILDYFEELKEVDTEKVEPMAGGTFLTDVKREDELRASDSKTTEKLIDAFSEREGRALKIPPVFE